MITIRQEHPEDIEIIRHVVTQAFDTGSRQSTEADLIDALRERGAITASLVVVQNDRVVGHILFSPATIEAEQSSIEAVALGPVAVIPDCQNQGIGTQLILNGLKRCLNAGYEIAVVLGHSDYYPRFGFVTARLKDIQFDFEAPDEVCMVMELCEGALSGRSGVVKYQPEFYG